MRRRHCNKPQSVTTSVFGYITRVCPVLFTGLVHAPTNGVQSSNCAATTQHLYSKGGQTLESQGLKVFFFLTFSTHFCPRDTVKNDLFVVVVCCDFFKIPFGTINENKGNRFEINYSNFILYRIICKRRNKKDTSWSLNGFNNNNNINNYCIC